ncbi:MAG TPA: hypothetical protein VMW47_04935 [Verrucomicrobiae bacterium]|nr:hypothetical protein [Verrucomicrobiae bacterium]
MEGEPLGSELTAATSTWEAGTRAAVAGWWAAVAVERDARWELGTVVQERVPMASYHPSGTGESCAEVPKRRLPTRLRQSPAPPGGRPMS